MPKQQAPHLRPLPKSSRPPPFAFKELDIDCDERDHRWLRGGNFFRTEEVAPPLREPLPSLHPSTAEILAAKAAAAAAGTEYVPPTSEIKEED